MNIAPLRDKTPDKNPWEGDCKKKPWDYEITAVIPVLDTPEPLKMVVELLRNQTINPFIMVIDTGSTNKNLKVIEKMRDEDLEVHSLRFNSVPHPSDFPAIAMDLAMSACRSNYLFATHADCFIKRQNLLEDMLNLAKTKSPVVGYEITPRPHADWVGMVSHTATMMHMPTMDKIGAGWSLRRLCNIYGIEDKRPNPDTPNWPDTEILLNCILRKYNIEPHLIGKELNFERNTDENIDHCRTLTSGLLYNKKYYKKAKLWTDDAMNEAQTRIDLWKKQ